LSDLVEEVNIEDYVFEGSPIIENPNGDVEDLDSDLSVVCFKLICPGKEDLWLVLWNCHNGYYSHGIIDYKGNEGSL
jgi:hypothetical protein